MSTPRSARSTSTIQVGTLRYDRSSVPANGGVAFVDAQGRIQVQNTLSNLETVSAQSATFPQLIVSGLTATSATITNLTASGITITGPTNFDSLVVSGDANVSGTIFAGNVDVSGGIETDMLTATGSATFNDSVTIDGHLQATSGTFTGAVQAEEINAEYLDVSGLKVGNDVDISGNFRVKKSSTFKGVVTFEQGVTIDGDLTILGNINDITINQTEHLMIDKVYASNTYSGIRDKFYSSSYALDVSGGARIKSGPLIVTAGGASITGGLTVSSGQLAVAVGGASITGGLTVSSGQLAVAVGGASIAGGATISGSLTTSSKITVQNGGVDISAGNLTLATGNVIVGGGELIKCGLAIDGSGAVIADGVIIKSGGAAIKGGLLVRSGGATITGTLQTTDRLTIQAGGADISGGLTVNGTGATINGTLRTGGKLTVQAGGTDISGGATITGNVVFKNGNVGVSSRVLPGTIFQVDVSKNALLGIAARSGDVNTIIGAFSDASNNNYGSIQTTKNGSILNTATPGSTPWGIQIQPLGGTTEIGLNKKQRITVTPTISYTKTINGTPVMSAYDSKNAAIMTVIDASVNRVEINGSLKLFRDGGSSGNGNPPSIYWGNDGLPDTGINHPGDNQLSLITGGSTRVHFKSGEDSPGNNTSQISLYSVPKPTLLTTLDIFPGRKGTTYDVSGWTTFDPNYYASADVSSGTLKNGANDQGGIYMFGNLEVANSIRTDSKVIAGRLELGSDGTASAPSIYWNTDTDTGINHSTANQISILTEGTTRMHITTDGVTIKNASDSTEVSTLSLQNSNTHSINFLTKATGSNYNYLAIGGSGDKVLWFSNGTINTGNLVIGPWSDKSGGVGLRVTNDGVTVGGNLTVTGTLSVNTMKTITSYVMYTVPSGNYILTYTAMGGGGGGGGNGGLWNGQRVAGGGGGSGYFTQGQIAVSSGDKLECLIGQGGYGGGGSDGINNSIPAQNGGPGGSGGTTRMVLYPGGDTTQGWDVVSVAGGSGGGGGASSAGGGGGNGGNGGYGGGGGGGAFTEGTIVNSNGGSGGTGQLLQYKNDASTNGQAGTGSGGAGGRGALGGRGGIAHVSSITESKSGGSGGGGGGPGGGIGGNSYNNDTYTPPLVGGSARSSSGAGGGGAGGGDVLACDGGSGANGYVSLLLIPA
jgi:fibronectin-binding autotransporter adhesin